MFPRAKTSKEEQKVAAGRAFCYAMVVTVLLAVRLWRESGGRLRNVTPVLRLTLLSQFVSLLPLLLVCHVPVLLQCASAFTCPSGKQYV